MSCEGAEHLAESIPSTYSRLMRIGQMLICLQVPFPGSMIGTAALALCAAVGITNPALAQEHSDQATVRRLSPASVADVASPDIYSNV